ncbi:MAG TPA: M24 family metallopeptidase [Thermoanaerobaculia bacterium]|nr:M24 family metallopeptidase [Thermoanaerobaculia bacterium]
MRFRNAALALAALCLLPLSPSHAAEPGWAPVGLPQDFVPKVRPLPPLRQQAEEQQAWLAQRLTEVLPALMREQGVEMWILSMREYAEDPVFFSMVSPTTFAARRRSIYVFHDQGPEKGVARLALGGSGQGGLFTAYRDPAPKVQGAELVGDDQWRLLRKLVEDANPKTIALNIDPVHAFADGLHAGEREALEAALGPELLKRVVRRPRLALQYVETRLPEMMPRYREIQETVHALIGTAFSSAVVRPGVTTTEDVSWWLRQRVQELGMTVWFQPHVEHAGAGADWGDGVIRRGDALWVDFGVIAQGLHTDTQHLGYVLKEGETAPPAGFAACIATSNRLQDLLLAEMRPGRTGNEVLAATRAAMTRAGIDGTIYSHPVGDHGHGAGPLIGLWDRQEGVPDRGDLPVRPRTWFSIELQATSPIPEWDGRKLACRQEEEAYLDDQGERHWLLRRQERFHLVK